jgi:hypothetical protein
MLTGVVVAVGFDDPHKFYPIGLPPGIETELLRYDRTVATIVPAGETVSAQGLAACRRQPPGVWTGVRD